MIPAFNEEILAAADRDNRNMHAAGYSMRQLMEDLKATIESGNVGITAMARDVDAIAKDGGAFSVNADTTTGLTFGFRDGRLLNAGTLVSVSAGTVALSNNAVNYIEVSAAGVVTANASGFSADRIPLYQVTTSGGAIAAIANRKPLLSIVGPSAIDASRAAAAIKTVPVSRAIGEITSTGEWLVGPLPDFPGRIVGVRIVDKSSHPASDDDYWVFAITNLTASTDVLAASAANTTQATGGFSLVDGETMPLSLSGTPANLETGPGDVLMITVAKTGAPTAMTDFIVVVDVEAVDA